MAPMTNSSINPNGDSVMTDVAQPTNPATPTITYNWNAVVAVSDMEPNTVYLDGAVQGPVVDNQRFSYSFDHHSNCVRSFTSATCKQVRDAIELGFPIHKINQIVVNDVDADTVLSVWCLLNPSRISEPKVVDLVERVGWTDSNFIATREAHPLHFTINGQKWKPENNTQASMTEKLAIIDQWLDGEFEPTEFTRPDARVIGLSSATGEVVFDADAQLIDAYQVADIVIGAAPAPKGGIAYIVGKISEFVPVDLPSVYNSCQAIEPNGSSEKNWNGSSTVGGAVFYEDGHRSNLEPEQVISIVQAAIL